LTDLLANFLERYNPGANAFLNSKELSTNYRIAVLISITFSRAVYSLNWYDLSPGLAQLARDFNVSLPSLGVLESAFLLGAGIFQIPASFTAARWNPKALAVGGMITVGVANVLFSLSQSFGFLIVMRFVLGIGASMFFAPALSVVAPLFKGQSQGLAVGIYNGAFNVGGAVALFGWNYLIALLGWRIALMIGGVLSIAFGAENFAVIRHQTGVANPSRNFAIARRALYGVLRNKQVWLLGVGFVGLWGALYSASQLVPYFEETIHGMNAFVASSLATIVFAVPIAVGPLGGLLSDRLGSRKGFLLYPTIILGLATAIIGFANLSLAIVIMVVLGATGALVYMAMYAIPFESEELRQEQKALSISLINSIQITGSFVAPILFSVVATSYLGFDGAWIFLGIFVLAFVPAVLWIREPKHEVPASLRFKA
jgi:MFS family permease